MSEVEFIRNLLERDWTPSITGRTTDVPQPTFTLEKSDREANLRSQDVGYVASGADTTYTPQGLGWNHRQVETAVVVEYRVATRTTATGYDDGYNRLYGERTGADGVGAPDRWDGIVGETERVILDNRVRTAEWDRVGANSSGEGITVRDLQDLGGANYYRADVLIPMDIIADQIDTST